MAYLMQQSRKRFLATALCLTIAGCYESNALQLKSGLDYTTIPTNELKRDKKSGPAVARVIFFFDDQIGWALCGESLCQSTDGGSSWRVINKKRIPDQFLFLRVL